MRPENNGAACYQNNTHHFSLNEEKTSGGTPRTPNAFFLESLNKRDYNHITWIMRQLLPSFRFIELKSEISSTKPNAEEAVGRLRGHKQQASVPGGTTFTSMCQHGGQRRGRRAACLSGDHDGSLSVISGKGRFPKWDLRQRRGRGAASGCIKRNVDASLNIDSQEDRQAQFCMTQVETLWRVAVNTKALLLGPRLAHELRTVGLNPGFKHMHVDSWFFFHPTEL